MRRLGLDVPVAPEIRAVVLTCDPEDVRPVRSLGKRRTPQEQKGKREEAEHGQALAVRSAHGNTTAT